MIPETPIQSTPEPVGEQLLFIIAAAVFAVVVAEAAFVAVGGMALMVATVLLALVVTGGVIYAVGRAIGPDDHE
jgi:hypothetical protein